MAEYLTIQEPVINGDYTGAKARIIASLQATSQTIFNNQLVVAKGSSNGVWIAVGSDNISTPSGTPVLRMANRSKSFKLMANAVGLRPVITNFTGDKTDPRWTNINVKLSYFTGYDGTPRPITFNGGNAFATVTNGNWLLPDPLGNFTAGTELFFIAIVEIAAGGYFPTQTPAENKSTIVNPPTDAPLNFLQQDFENNGVYVSYAFNVVAVIATLPQGTVVVQTGGDSIMEQYGLTSHISDQLPTLMVAVPGDTIRAAVENLNATKFTWAQMCTSSFWNYGINDFQEGRSDIDIAADNLRAAYQLKANGIKRHFICTITPGDLMLPYNQQQRQLYNARVRDGFPIDKVAKTIVPAGTTGTNIIRTGNTEHPVYGFFDLAAQVEDPNNPGKWIAAYTSDDWKIHPNTTGTAKLQNIILKEQFV